jgi:hypothetical protein
MDRRIMPSPSLRVNERASDCWTGLVEGFGRSLARRLVNHAAPNDACEARARARVLNQGCWRSTV